MFFVSFVLKKRIPHKGHKKLKEYLVDLADAGLAIADVKITTLHVR